jgi:hypothetical protein
MHNTHTQNTHLAFYIELWNMNGVMSDANANMNK